MKNKYEQIPPATTHLPTPAHVLREARWCGQKQVGAAAFPAQEVKPLAKGAEE